MPTAGARASTRPSRLVPARSLTVTYFRCRDSGHRDGEVQVHLDQLTPAAARSWEFCGSASDATSGISRRGHAPTLERDCGECRSDGQVRSSATTADTAIRCSPAATAISVTAYVTDDDTGTTSSFKNLGTGLDFYDAQFSPPIKENERNIAKYGNVVPIKVGPAEQVLPGHEADLADPPHHGGRGEHDQRLGPRWT